MKPQSAPELSRLAQARPSIATRTHAVSDSFDRQRLLQRIASDPEVPLLPGPRRRPGKVIMAGSAVAAAGAVAAGLVIFGGPAPAHIVNVAGSGQKGRGPGGRTMVVRDAAYVAAQALGAMNAPNEAILETESKLVAEWHGLGSSSNKQWQYPLVPSPGQEVQISRTEASASGQPISASSEKVTQPSQPITQPTPSQTSSCPSGTIGSFTDIEYTSRTWSSGPWCVRPGDLNTPNPLSAPAPSSAGGTTESIQAELAQGGWTIVGHPTIDGQRSIELSSSRYVLQNDLWVSATTYLPIKSTSGGPKAGQPPSPYWNITTTYTYLQPTTANLAHLTVAIPAGFTQVSSGPG
ncbi:MAG: hypothetical protein ACRDX8_07810 [Acidimicrobiales bacterium]